MVLVLARAAADRQALVDLAVHAAIPSNTMAVYGKGQVKELTELVPGILSQLGPDSLASLRKLAESYQQMSQQQQAGASPFLSPGRGRVPCGPVADRVRSVLQASRRMTTRSPRRPRTLTPSRRPMRPSKEIWAARIAPPLDGREGLRTVYEKLARTSAFLVREERRGCCVLGGKTGARVVEG